MNNSTLGDSYDPEDWKVRLVVYSEINDASLWQIAISIVRNKNV